MRPLEDVETAAVHDFYGHPPGEVHELASGGACLVVRSLPVRWINRVAGLGLDAPATDDDLDRIAAVYDGLEHSVAVSPHAEGLAERLVARGYVPGYAWMKFSRGVEPLEARATELEVRDASGNDFAAVVCAAYGFPETLAPMLAALPGRDGWHCFTAHAGGSALGAGALYVAGDHGWLGFAGTLAEARGRGAQGAILSARIDRARAVGCRVLATETGVVEAGRPSNSYRNILRAGFSEAGVRPNYIS